MHAIFAHRGVRSGRLEGDTLSDADAGSAPSPTARAPETVDGLAEALRADSGNPALWRRYATALIENGDDFGPVVARGVLGESIEEHFIGLDPKVLLLGGLSRLGTVQTVSWHYGLDLELDGAEPAGWMPVASLDTDFAFLRLRVDDVPVHALGGLRRMPRLQSLSLSSQSLAPLDVELLARFGPLTTLELSGFELDDLEPLQGHTSLSRLTLRGWWGTDDLLPLAALPSLRTLELEDCGALPDIYDVVAVLGLEHLSITRNDAVTEIEPIGALANLESLTLEGLPQLTDAAPLTQLTGLRSLTLGRTGIEDLSPLAELSQLRSLTLVDCPASDLEGLERLEHLEALTLDRCRNLRKLSFLGRLPNLQALTLRRCRRLRALPRFRKRSQLRHLTLELCPALTNLAPLSALQHLESLTLGATQAEDPSPLFELTSLQEARFIAPHIDADLVTAARARGVGAWSEEGDALVLRRMG